MPQPRKPANLHVHVEDEILKGSGLGHVYVPFLIHHFVPRDQVCGVPTPAKERNVAGVVNSHREVIAHDRFWFTSDASASLTPNKATVELLPFLEPLVVHAEL